MPPPKDLPGLYFDPKKNRYFPIKGPIPGLKHHSSSIPEESSENNKRHRINKERKRSIIKPLELLQFREVLGTTVMSNRSKSNFKKEYEKSQASHPQVWKYEGTGCVADSYLEQMHGVIQTPEGLKEASFLFAGSRTGSISLNGVGNSPQCFDSGLISSHTPETIWSGGTVNKARNNTLFGSIWRSPELSAIFPSSISCIQRICRHSPGLADDASSFQRALVTTLGSGLSGGCVYTLNMTEPLDLSQRALHLCRRMSKVNLFDCTIWTAACSRNGTHAAIGTNMGAALINLETTASSWVYHTKSDIFSQQFDHSGNIILCGLRNGAITVVDLRENRLRLSEVSSRHTAVPSVQRVNHRRSKQRFEAKRSSTSSSDLFMTSSVCSLVTLQSDDQYFLCSSMDGTIKLFDRRLLHRGAIQSYEGNVNSHSHLQLGVNPSETLFLSGGEDRCVRIWSIKSGELIFEENVSDSIHAAACWPQGNLSETNHSWGAWLGSHEGLFHMHGT